MHSIWQGNVSAQGRSRLWIYQCPVYEVQEHVRKLLKIEDPLASCYREIHKRIEDRRSLDDTAFDMDRVVYDIEKDIPRTYTVAKFGERELFRVLIALAYVKPSIGYCQGLNFVAGILLLVLQSEEVAFWLLLGMMHKYHMETLFMQGVPDLLLREHQMQHFIKNYLPDLHMHFRKAGIGSELFLSRWIMTIYACYLPLETLLHVWDCFMVQGWKVVFKIGIAILREQKPDLMAFELDDVSKFFRDNTRNCHFNSRKLLAEASTIKIHNTELKKVEEAYFIEQARLKLQVSENNHQCSENDVQALREAKEQFDKFDEPSRKYVAAFQEKIEKISKELDNFNTYYLTVTRDLLSVEHDIEALSEQKGLYVTSLKTMEKKRKQSKTARILKKLLPRKKQANLPVVTVLIQHPQPSASETFIREEDISLNRHKLEGIDQELKWLQKQHSEKYSVYYEAKTRYEEMKEKKVSYAEQLKGFLEMLNLKKTETLQKLSSELKPRRS